MPSSRLRTLTRLTPVLAAVVLLPSAITAASATQAADVLLSQGKPVATSTVESSSYAGTKAVDGSTTTRWASAEGADPQWLRIDLGQSAAIHRVVLNWEAAYAKKYRIETSDDGTTFTPAATVDNGDGKTDELTVTAHGRYVRLVGLTRATSYGYSLWEMQVFGSTDSSGDTQAPTTPPPSPPARRPAPASP